MEGGLRWILDRLPAELSEQVYMQQREQGVENEGGWRQEWSCSGWVPGLDEDLVTEVGWQGERWEQKGAKEMMAGGVELQLLGEGRGSMCTH